MKDKDYWKYFIKISGDFNERVHARYRNRLVGDSPEMARGLDSYGFSDLMVSLAFHVALSYKLDKDNRKKIPTWNSTRSRTLNQSLLESRAYR